VEMELETARRARWRAGSCEIVNEGLPTLWLLFGS
jgi:hypothetical protein